MDVLDSLGEDLVLLSVSPADGKVTTAQRIGFGLMGSELVRLAAAGRITITGGRGPTPPTRHHPNHAAPPHPRGTTA